METIHGLSTYVAEPSSGQTLGGIIVIIPDAFGWRFPNTRILADRYSRRTNSRVFLPDFMNDHSLAFDMLPTLDAITAEASGLRNLAKMFVHNLHFLSCY